jgi:cysteine-S-conjugate beta-lyase
MTTLSTELTEVPLERLRQRRSAKWAMYGDEALPAWVAEMDFPLAPPVKRALLDAVGRDDTGYAAPAELGLAEAFAGFARERLGWEVDPAMVTASANVVGALTATLRALTKPGDRVVINPPVYHPFFAIVEEVGAELAEVPLVDGELDVAGIEREFAAGAVAIVLCSPHNPSGGLPSRGQLEAIAAAAARHGAWVLADEIWAPLTLPGAEHVPFLTVSEEAREHGIAFASASKAFNVAGLSCSQIVTAGEGPAALVEALPFGAKHPGHHGAIAAVAAFREGGAWLDEVVAVLDHNRGLLGELLAERLPEVGYVPPRAGYLTWLDLRAYGLGDDPSEAILERGGLALNPGPSFGTEGKGFVRLNVGTSPALVEEAVERLAKGVGR